MEVQQDSLSGNNAQNSAAAHSQSAEHSVDDIVGRFNRDGYVVIENAINDELCVELLQFIVASFSDTEPDYIIAPDFRIHAPLRLNPLTREAIGQVARPVYGVLDQFLKGEQYLVELSSITVFPHARPQNLHPDESNPGKYIVSVFVNLAPTHADSGALLIVPGSHLTQDKEFTISEAIPVELPVGSAVFMNSKTWHCGGANQSFDRIRPVFYFSFGDQELEGPTYSIREGVKSMRLSLRDFKQGYLRNSRVMFPDVPVFSAGVDLLSSICNEDRVFITRDGDSVGSFSVEERWILDAVRMIGDASQHYSIAEMVAILACEPEQLLHVCQKLQEAGIIYCEKAVSTASPEAQAIASGSGYSVKPTPFPGSQ